MKFLVFALATLCLLAFVSARPKWHQLEKYSFDRYTKDFSKVYSNTEYATRKKIFEARLDEIRTHNSNPSFTWKQGVNHMTDWTEDEFKLTLGYKYMPHQGPRNYVEGKKIDMDALPSSVDWRSKGIVTSVKDQGMCGSCWTFGTAETVESYYAMATGALTVFSEQQILDCTPNPDDCGGIGGCGGGTPELAYAKIMQMGGLSTEWTYPYISYFTQNQTCQAGGDRFQPVAVVANYTVLPSNQLAPVMQALATVGPLAINVDASAWSSYESGVFDGCDQSDPDIDHVVQLVGYGTDPSYGDYWTVRNSWSPLWGETGYIRLRRTSTPRCGTDTQPSDGTGCKGGPSSVTVCGTCGILYDVSYPIVKS